MQGLLTPQLFGVAVPIHDRNNQPIAALNVTTYTAVPNWIAVNEFLLPLSETKSQIEAALRSSNAIPLANGLF